MEIKKAYNFSDAIELLEKAGRNAFEIVLLDINLPKCTNGPIKNGEDLGNKIKKLYPEIKIIVLTMLNDSLRIRSIIENLDPNGFILKSEITANLLIGAIEDVLGNKKSFSNEVIRYFLSICPLG